MLCAFFAALDGALLDGEQHSAGHHIPMGHAREALMSTTLRKFRSIDEQTQSPLTVVQGRATVPSSPERVTAATCFASHHLLAGHIWEALLTQLSFRPGTAPKAARGHIEAVAAELASLLQAPEWPAAEVLLWSFMAQVQTLEQSLAGRKGAVKGSMLQEDREQLLELEGHLVSLV
jgi:hypothetical protein